MEIDRLPPSVLNGKFLHCRPVEDGMVIEAPILSSEGLLPTAKFVIVCPARIPGSKCKLRIEAGSATEIFPVGNSCLTQKYPLS